MNPIKKENKVEKSLRNTKEFAAVLARAQKGEFDKELQDARDNGELQGTSGRLPLLKVTEVWSIRKHFSLDTGTDYFKLYKEKFYVENPGSHYFETVNPVIYRSVVAQREEGDAEWAKNVGAHLGIQVEAAKAKTTRKTTAKKKTTKKK